MTTRQKERAVYKDPLDRTKASKRGRFAVVHRGGTIVTTSLRDIIEGQNLLVPVFENGMVLKQHTFAEIRARITHEVETRVSARETAHA